MLRILANDGMAKSAVEKLESLGHTVVTEFHDVETLKTVLKTDYDVLIVRSATKVREELIDVIKGGSLKLVIRAGVGIDNIDYKYAEANGITVNNTPKASSASVAELAIAHMFAISRFIHIANVEMRDGVWNKKAYSKGVELCGKTLGIIGYGRIGHEVARRAEALGMNIMYFSHECYIDTPANYKCVDKETLLKEADYISLHIPFIKEEGPSITKKEFAIMKDGVFIVNAARGGVINEADLIEALDSGKVAAAGMDVFEEEPTKNTALINHPKVSATPHIGASTVEAQTRIGLETIDTILKHFDLK